MRSLMVGLCLVFLSACSSKKQELQEWMDDVKKQVKPTSVKISEPKKFEPYLYTSQSEISPFDPVKVTNALNRLAARSKSPLAPDPDRRREVLEAFPLDSIHMEGMIENRNLRYALLRVKNGATYPVQVGNYVGQNFGMVTKITENEVTLKEVIQDAGDWVERITTLQLQESKK